MISILKTTTVLAVYLWVIRLWVTLSLYFILILNFVIFHLKRCYFCNYIITITVMDDLKLQRGLLNFLLLRVGAS